MKKLSIPLLLLLLTLTGAHSYALASAPAGRVLFDDQKCAKCHTIASQGIDRSGAPPQGKLPPDLSAVGTKHTADWMQQWLMKTIEMNGKKHMKKFTGSDDELKTLTNWLASLKTKTTSMTTSTITTTPQKSTTLSTTTTTTSTSTNNATPSIGSGFVNYANIVTRETPSGTLDGTNTIFTLTNAPLPGSEEVFLNGILREPGIGNEYTITGNLLTCLNAPASTDRLRVSYRK
jgi:mono/diheme cytochrome c family protein